MGVLEQPHQVGLGGLLQRQNGEGLEVQVGFFVVLCQFPYKPGEGKLPNQEFRTALIAANLLERDCSRTVPARSKRKK